MQKIILAVDIGTSALKAALIDIGDYNKTRLYAFYRAPYYVAVPMASDWKAALIRSIYAISRIIDAWKIEAVCISGNGPTLVPIAKDNTAFKPLHWFGKLKKLRGMSSFFLPYIAAYMDTNYDQFNKIQLFLSCQEWLSYTLGAEPVTILPTQEYSKYYFDSEECAFLGISDKLFPKTVCTGTIIGNVSYHAANLFGIPSGIPIIAGGPDFIMALLGSGIVRHGDVCDRSGSSEGINVCVRKEYADIASKIPGIRVLPHIIQGYINVGVIIPESGNIFDRWIHENKKNDKSYDEILSELIIDNKNAHPVIKTIVNKVCSAIDILGSAGFIIKEMRLSGGQSKNERWNSYKAHITGCTLLEPEIQDGELAGCAAVSMLALGLIKTLKEASESIFKVKKYYTP